MDDLRVGRTVRAVRRRRGLRQADIAGLAGVGQSMVSEIERGQLEALQVRTIRSVCAALEIGLRFDPSWRGSQMARLLDAGHAAAVDAVAAALTRHGWEIALEYTFSVYGERGSVDVLAWRRPERALLILEVKTELSDLQDLLSVLDRKARLVPRLVAAERGWRATTLGVAVVMREGSSARDALARHRATFEAALPQRGVDVRRWLARPGPGGLRGVWLLRHIAPGGVMKGHGGPRRVRVPAAPSSGTPGCSWAPDSGPRRRPRGAGTARGSTTLT